MSSAFNPTIMLLLDYRKAITSPPQYDRVFSEARDGDSEDEVYRYIVSGEILAESIVGVYRVAPGEVTQDLSDKFAQRIANQSLTNDVCEKAIAFAEAHGFVFKQAAE